MSPRDTTWCNSHGYMTMYAEMKGQEMGAARATRHDIMNDVKIGVAMATRQYIEVALEQCEGMRRIASVCIPPEASRHFSDDVNDIFDCSKAADIMAGGGSTSRCSPPDAS